MSLAVEPADLPGIIESGDTYWGKEVPKELQEEATLVSKVALDLFQKLKIHPNVYVPCAKNHLKDWCKFFWSNNSGQHGFIQLNRDIKAEKGKKKEIPHIEIQNVYRKEASKSPNIDNATFTIETSESNYTTMPAELRKEAENLVKVSSVFFRKLVEHPDVITREGGYFISDWDRFDCFDKQGILRNSLAFSDMLNDSGNRVQRLLIKAM